MLTTANDLSFSSVHGETSNNVAFKPWTDSRSRFFYPLLGYVSGRSHQTTFGGLWPDSFLGQLMAWIKSHQALERHPKVLALQQLTGFDRNGTVGVLHRFWYWVADYAEDGNLSKFPIESISTVLGIDATHLIKAGWIDEKPELRVHDWFDHFGEYLRTKYRKHPEKYETIKRYCTGTIPVQNRLDKIDKIDKIDTKEGTRQPAFIKPTLDQVTTYCQERGNAVDSEKWFAYYESNGWRVGRNPMKNWKAAVRTWEKSQFVANGQTPIRSKVKSWEEDALKEIQKKQEAKLGQN